MISRKSDGLRVGLRRRAVGLKAPREPAALRVRTALAVRPQHATAGAAAMPVRRQRRVVISDRRKPPAARFVADRPLREQRRPSRQVGRVLIRPMVPGLGHPADCRAQQGRIARVSTVQDGPSPWRAHQKNRARPVLMMFAAVISTALVLITNTLVAPSKGISGRGGCRSSSSRSSGWCGAGSRATPSRRAGRRRHECAYRMLMIRLGLMCMAAPTGWPSTQLIPFARSMRGSGSVIVSQSSCDRTVFS